MIKISVLMTTLLSELEQEKIIRERYGYVHLIVYSVVSNEVLKDKPYALANKKKSQWLDGMNKEMNLFHMKYLDSSS